MKKLLVAVIAVFTVSAMADGHNHSGMITFDDFNGDANSQTFDLSFGDNGTDSTQTIILNYTHAFSGTWMAGLSYKAIDNGGGDETDGMGVHIYYNTDHKVVDTCFVGLHYTTDENDSTKTENTRMALEYGHRFGLGSWKGWHLAFSPSVNYWTNTKDVNGTETDTNGLQWNWIKFDVLF